MGAIFIIWFIIYKSLPFCDLFFRREYLWIYNNTFNIAPTWRSLFTFNELLHFPSILFNSLWFIIVLYIRSFHLNKRQFCWNHFLIYLYFIHKLHNCKIVIFLSCFIWTICGHKQISMGGIIPPWVTNQSRANKDII